MAHRVLETKICGFLQTNLFSRFLHCTTEFWLVEPVLIALPFSATCATRTGQEKLKSGISQKLSTVRISYADLMRTAYLVTLNAFSKLTQVHKNLRDTLYWPTFESQSENVRGNFRLRTDFVQIQIPVL